MSLLQKTKEDLTLTCKIKQEGDKITLNFYADSVKSGSWGMIDGYKLTPERLLHILQSWGYYFDDEL